MADDNGVAAVQAGLSLGMAGPLGVFAGVAYAATAAALQVQYDELKDYQKLVDDLLKTLKESPAHHGKLEDGTLPVGALGKDFAQADKLYKAYTTVHTELKNLSKGLAVQIEALGIAVQTAGKGYADVDEETKRRMALLAKQAHDQYVVKRDPYADKMAEGGQAAPTKKGVVLG
ncbi:hypothetical protein ACFYZ4_23960 [Streptomyces sp. NPDC001513]|uniref:hypothetical protein n=1 Tax=Streptomyces sp. NPDC001513 TaxID=3364580 RepID=UPI0036C163AA